MQVTSDEDEADYFAYSDIPVIISPKCAWHLDEPYRKWNYIYDRVFLFIFVSNERTNVLGGEILMWGDYVDDSAIDAKVWPRTAAFAEKVWTHQTRPERRRTASVTYRILQQRHRLIQLGIKAEAIVPDWCKYNEGMCEWD